MCHETSAGAHNGGPRLHDAWLTKGHSERRQVTSPAGVGTATEEGNRDTGPASL